MEDKMVDRSPPFLIQNIADLSSFAEETSHQQQQEHVFFNIQDHTTSQFGHFVQKFAALRDCFEHIQQITLQANITWTQIHAKDFLEILSVLPNLRILDWKACSKNRSRIPIPTLTILLTLCTKLESLSLQGLSFLATLGTLEHAFGVFANHDHLKLFRCWDCSVVERDTSNNLTEYFVKSVLTSSMFLNSLECIDVRVPPTDEHPRRALLGLCRHGIVADTALESFQQLLRENKPYGKIRLWMDARYQPTKNAQGVLLDLAPLVAQNTVVKDFRVRGQAEKFVSKDVVDAYKEFLELGENTCLTGCDLMEKQGGQIDFYCRLNGLGRGDLMQQLHDMTRDEWVENVLLRFVDDLDVLFYWNRLHPVFFTVND